jgi:exosortase family protein XrtM
MARERSLTGFVALFALIFSALQFAYLKAGAPADYWLVERATVDASAYLFGIVDPSASVRAEGTRLVSPAARMSVLRGCEGTELYLLWIAAVLAFPSAWLRKAACLVAGLAVAYGLNQARLMALFYVVRDYRQYFELAHGYVAPTLLVLLLGLLFWQWTANAKAG